jgi:hypothetical protein
MHLYYDQRIIVLVGIVKKNIFLFVFETFKPSLYIIEITNKNVPHKKVLTKTDTDTEIRENNMLAPISTI